jgi:hypothetical protein
LSGPTSRHLGRIESTNRSANAFKFGLLAGNLTAFTPPQDSAEALCVKRIPIDQDIPLADQKAVDRIDEIPCHLLHPRAAGICDNPDDLHPPAGEPVILVFWAAIGVPKPTILMDLEFARTARNRLIS